MPTRWDLTAFNRDNQLVLVVEVKGKLGATKKWADQLRRNIFAHGTFPKAPYFLMAFPDRFYLWKNTKSQPGPLEAAYVIDARPILQPYFEQSGLTPDQVSGQSLELIVTSWLGEIMYKPANELTASQQWLVESGLHSAIAEGSIAGEAVA